MKSTGARPRRRRPAGRTIVHQPPYDDMHWIVEDERLFLQQMYHEHGPDYLNGNGPVGEPGPVDDVDEFEPDDAEIIPLRSGLGGDEEDAPPAWHDFADLAAGRRTRAKPTYGERTDGQPLIYPGKEHTVYGETEAGKGMFLAEVARQCLLDGVAVAVIDFEEGDELEWGSRLLDMGVPPEVLNKRELFRYGTPVDKGAAERLRHDVLEMRPVLLILEGVSAAYGVYGWQVKENDSATLFRAGLVKPAMRPWDCHPCLGPRGQER